MLFEVVRDQKGFERKLALDALRHLGPSAASLANALAAFLVEVTATGHEVITRFPAEQLLVAGAPFVTVSGELPTVRETEAPPNPEVAKMVAAAAKAEAPVGAGSRG